MPDGRERRPDHRRADVGDIRVRRISPAPCFYGGDHRYNVAKSGAAFCDVISMIAAIETWRRRYSSNSNVADISTSMIRPSFATIWHSTLSQRPVLRKAGG